MKNNSETPETIPQLSQDDPESRFPFLVEGRFHRVIDAPANDVRASFVRTVRESGYGYRYLQYVSSDFGLNGRSQVMKQKRLFRSQQEVITVPMLHQCCSISASTIVSYIEDRPQEAQ